MDRQPTRSTRTYTLFPYTTRFRFPSPPRRRRRLRGRARPRVRLPPPRAQPGRVQQAAREAAGRKTGAANARWTRSEEHTSELQSLMRISYAVFCLKKKNNAEMDKTRHPECHIKYTEQ